MTDDVKAVKLSELSSLVGEFFDSDYYVRRWGIQGRWGGSDFPALTAIPEMDRKDFTHVFSFRSWSGRFGPPPSWQESNPVIAQRLTLDSCPELSTLWALGKPAQRNQILHTVYDTTKQVMGYLRSISTLENESSGSFLSRGCRHATFVERVTDEGIPRIRTTVLIAQQYRIWGNKEVRFPLDLEPGAASALFRRCEWRRLTDRIGTFGLTPKTRIPRNLFAPLADKAVSRNETSASMLGWPDEPQPRLSWQMQAAAKGFGPKQVQDSFNAARDLGLVVNLLRNNLTPIGPKVISEAVFRSQKSKDSPAKSMSPYSPNSPSF
jgi:hypothetical protein